MMYNHRYGVRKHLFQEQEQTANLYYDFKELLKEKLFLKNIQATFSKESLSKFVNPINIEEAIETAKFIRYGTAKATNFIIIDIDNVKGDIYTYKDIVNKALDGYQASWILKSEKGFHVGFILDKPVYFNNKKERVEFENLKIALSFILNADTNGSVRKIGFWRNPIKHISIFNTNLHNLKELTKLARSLYDNRISLFDSPEVQFQKIEEKDMSLAALAKKTWSNIDKKGFIEGNRNNYLYNKIVGLLYSGKIKQSEIFKTIHEINFSMENPLPLQEIKATAKQIKKYNIKPNKAKSEKEYIHVRGKYFDSMYKYGIHNYTVSNKTKYARQELGQAIRTAAVIVKTSVKLIDGYVDLYKKNKKNSYTNKEIAESSNVSIRTIQRFRNNRKVENLIKAIAFKTYLFNLCSKGKAKAKETVMANVTPLKDFFHKLIKNVIFKYKKTKITLNFRVNEDGRVEFYNREQEFVFNDIRYKMRIA